MLQNTAQSKPLSEKSKNMRRCRCFSPSPILPPSKRAKSWRGVCRTAGHKAKKLSFAKVQKANLISEYIPTATLSRYAAKKDTRNNFAFEISSKLVCRQAEQKARHGIPKTTQIHGNIFTPQTITSRRFFKHDLYSNERSQTK